LFIIIINSDDTISALTLEEKCHGIKQCRHVVYVITFVLDVFTENVPVYSLSVV